MIGYDWLKENEVFWGFGLGKISIGDRIFPLLPRDKDTYASNRVVMQEKIVIPTPSEAIDLNKITFGNELLAKTKLQPGNNDEEKEATSILLPKDIPKTLHTDIMIEPKHKDERKTIHKNLDYSFPNMMKSTNARLPIKGRSKQSFPDKDEVRRLLSGLVEMESLPKSCRHGTLKKTNIHRGNEDGEMMQEVSQSGESAHRLRHQY